MKILKIRLPFLSALILFATPAFASPIANLEDFVRAMNLTPLYRQTANRGAGLKIAVLDNSFAGWEAAKAAGDLPANAQYHPGPVTPPAPSQTDEHGRVMAEILYGLLTHDGATAAFVPAEFHLYNAFGYSNLKAAIDDVIARKIDLVLYAQNWEYGGNLNGQGFIDALVGEATAAGVTWVNSAGDFGDTTFNANVRAGPDGWAALPGPNQSVELHCDAPAGTTCPLRLVLSWNDFQNDPNAGTTKDLDLILTDDSLNIVSSSQLVQVANDDSQPGTSLYPREIIETAVKSGVYYARVKIRSTNFTATDRLRLTASGTYLSMPRHDASESLLVPADRTDVIAVGAGDTPKSSRSKFLGKPDLSLNSVIKLTDTSGPSGGEYAGTSSAAAAATAGIAILKSLHPTWSSAALAAALQRRITAATSGIPSDTVGPGQGLPLNQLGFTASTGSDCFQPVDPDQVSAPSYVRALLAQGGTLVLTSLGEKVFFTVDPITYFPTLHRIAANDVLAVTPSGPGLFPRSADAQLSGQVYEALELPLGAYICGDNQ